MVHRILLLTKIEPKEGDVLSYPKKTVELDNIYEATVSDVGHQPMQVMNLERREANEASATMHRLLQTEFPVRGQGNAGRSWILS